MWWKSRKVALRENWVIVVIVLGSGIALVFGYFGYCEHNEKGALSLSWDAFWDNLYQSFQLFALEANFNPGRPINTCLQIARFAAPIVTAAALVKLFLLLFAEQLRLLLLQFCSDHVVICGLGRIGSLLADSYQKAGHRVVIIEKDKNNGFVDQFQGRGIHVLVGDAGDREQLEKANIGEAKILICACGDDARNLEVGLTVLQIVPRRINRPLETYCHIADRRLCDLLTQQEIEARRADSVRLSFFNVFEQGARLLVDEFFSPSCPSTAKENSPRILVIGDGALSQSFILQAALSWNLSASGGKKFHLSLVDREAEGRIEALQALYPDLSARCCAQGLSISLDSTKFEEAAFLFDAHGNLAFSRIFILPDGDAAALATALALQERLASYSVTIILAMTYERSLVEGVWERKRSLLTPIELKVFNLLLRVLRPEVMARTGVEEMAIAFHQDYVERQEAKGETLESNSSLKDWADLSDDLRESNRQLAEHIGPKLGAIKCYLVPRRAWDEELFCFKPGEVKLLAKLEHERYRTERKSQGWTRVLKKKKSNRLRENPTLVSWDELSLDEQEKDLEIVRNMPALLAKAGFAIRRLEENSEMKRGVSPDV